MKIWIRGLGVGRDVQHLAAAIRSGGDRDGAGRARPHVPLAPIAEALIGPDRERNVVDADRLATVGILGVLLLQPDVMGGTQLHVGIPCRVHKGHHAVAVGYGLLVGGLLEGSEDQVEG